MQQIERNMQSQIILITGASSGFGKITSQMLSEQGHIVYGTSRKTSENMGKELGFETFQPRNGTDWRAELTAILEE